MNRNLRNLLFFILTFCFVFLLPAFGAENIPVYGYAVVRSYPHDTASFTEGLAYKDGFLFEGTGLAGHSALRKIDLASAKTVKSRKLPKKYFGEGVTIAGDKIIRLTESHNIGFIYDIESFKLLGTFTYPTLGWGICYDGKNLIMSDGTANLYFLDAKNFKKIKSVNVRAGGLPVDNINELEYVKGKIYANIWHGNKIAVIDPQTGQVRAWIDLSGLLSGEDGKKIAVSLEKNFPVLDINEACLNGIAYDEINDRLFVTGKLWPKIFEIKVK